jgi:AcrR family transcriptional regulator
VQVQASLRQQQKRARRARIFEAAIRLFHERGFHATTIVDIAEAAEVSRGTFFNYYPYKEAILLEYAADRLRGLAERVEARVGEDADPLGTLALIFDALADFVATNRALILPLSYELLNPDPERSRIAYEVLPLARILATVLEQGQRSCQVRRDLSKERLARTLANAYFMTALQWAAYRSDCSIHEEMRLTLRLTLEGVRTPDGAAL